MSYFNDSLKELFWKIINFCMSKIKRNQLQKYQHVSGYILSLNTLRTGSFKLFKLPFPGVLTILTL